VTRTTLLWLAVAGGLCLTPAVSAQAKPSSPRKVTFSCERATFPLLPSRKPDLVLTFAEEAVISDAASVKKRSDIELIDRTGIFGDARDFSLSGHWPGTLTVTGAAKGVELGRVTIRPAPRELYAINGGWTPAYSAIDPRRAVIISKSMGGPEASGGCTTFHLIRTRL
jgi:hypothetical protein